MSKVPDGFFTVPFIEGQWPEDMAPRFGKVTGKETVSMTLYVDQVRGYHDATSLVPYTIGQAAHVFGLIYRMTSAGFPMSEAELCSLAELCQRGLDAVAEKEGEALSQLDIVLRSVLQAHVKKATSAEGVPA